MGSSPTHQKEGSTPSGRPSRRRSISFSSPSPAHYHLSTIPFSWEQQPGVPKQNPLAAENPSSDPLLPLPPPLGSRSAHCRIRSDLDPFAAAMAECARDNDGAEIWRKAAAGRRRAVAAAICSRLAIADLYGSCKSACSVADSTTRVRRSGGHVGSYGLLLNRRSG